MRTHSKSKEESPLDLLKELAIEGTSSLVEAQRTLLGLAQQENDIVLNSVKEQIGTFVPGAAMTDLVRRSLDTLIGMQQELLTSTSRQALELIDSDETQKPDRSEHLTRLASEAVETFTRAQKQFLEILAQESAQVTSGKPAQQEKVAKKTRLDAVAHEASNAFIEAQKQLLDVMGQQMKVNVDLSARATNLVNFFPSLPLSRFTSESVAKLLDTEKSLIGSLIPARKPKVARRAKPGRNRKQHAQVAV